MNVSLKCPTCNRPFAVVPEKASGLHLIRETVAKAYGITVETMLTSAIRAPLVVEARRTAIVIGWRQHPEATKIHLAEAFGYRTSSKRMVYEAISRAADLPMLDELMVRCAA